MTKYKKFMSYWNAMECAVEENEIELQNLLLEKIESLLPFKNESEHDAWYDVVGTYKFFEDFEEYTMTIARRLIK